MNELTYIQKNLKAPKTQTNKFGGYKYRSCEDILEAVKPLLAEQECTLTLSDEVIAVGNRIYVRATATLKAKVNHWEVTALAREEETKKGMDASQITGTASSYARKYALNGLFAIDDTKDADATNMHGKDTAKAKATQAPAIQPIADDKAAPTLKDAIDGIILLTTPASLKAYCNDNQKYWGEQAFTDAAKARRAEIKQMFNL